MTGPVFVIDAVRTPIGKIGGALADTRPDDLTRVATAASEFLLEVLATYDMAQRRFREE